MPKIGLKAANMHDVSSLKLKIVKMCSFLLKPGCFTIDTVNLICTVAAICLGTGLFGSILHHVTIEGAVGSLLKTTPLTISVCPDGNMLVWMYLNTSMWLT